jgi:hypothetical protein
MPRPAGEMFKVRSLPSQLPEKVEKSEDPNDTSAICFDELPAITPPLTV